VEPQDVLAVRNVLAGEDLVGVRAGESVHQDQIQANERTAEYASFSL
jgi:hypothetical protein